jgi:hypothetical protein
MAELGWVYFSKEHKETAGTIIKMMAAEGMVDELGIGAIRDAFANQLFVGISTVQTRAKYFFIVPYILLDYQKVFQTIGITKDPRRYLEDEENRIMWQLRDKYLPIEKETGIKSNIIGITLRGKDRIVRRPSSIYWGGIGAFKIINNKGLGVDSFLSSVINVGKKSAFCELILGDEGNSDDVDGNYIDMMKIHPSIQPEENWKTDLNIELTQSEAELLFDLILKHQGNTLLAHILQNKEAQKALNADWCNSFADFAKVASQLNLKEELVQQIYLAHHFSEVMYGSNLAYNYWLQLDSKRNDGTLLIDDWNAWKENLHSSLLYKNTFDIELVLSSDIAKTTKESTKQFIRKWWALVNSNATIAETKELILKQELKNKRNKARLNNNIWDDVIDGKMLGLGRLNYRFAQAKRIINDILNALN